MDFVLLFKIIALTLLLLFCAFICLWLLKRLHPAFALPARGGVIEILDRKVDFSIGTIAVVSVLGEHYVLLVAKSGVAIHALDTKSESSKESY